MAELAAEPFSSLVGAIYDCAIDPDRWDGTLDRIRLSLNCQNTQLALHERSSGRMLISKSIGFTQFWLDKQTEVMGDIFTFWAPALAALTGPVDEPVLARSAMTETFPRNNRYAKEWVEPQGLVDAMALFHIRDEDRMSKLTFGRHQSQGFFSETDVSALRLLAPHLRRAITISNVIDVATIAASNFRVALDQLSMGVFLVDDGARLIHANKAGEEILAAGSTVSFKSGAISLQLPAATRAITNAVRLAAAEEMSIGWTGMNVPVHSAAGRGHVAHVLPLCPTGHRRAWSPRAVAAIFVAPQAAGPLVPAGVLTALYDLTPAEARVALAVAAGKTPADAAAEFGVSDQTVRSHLLKIYAKTNTSRQAELAILVGALSLPVQTEA